MQTVSPAARDSRKAKLEIPQWAEASLKWGSVLSYLGFLLWTCSTPFRHHAPLVQYTEDDFFYYLKIAQNFAAGRGSSFDGIHLTNGYHPLWFLLFAAVSLLSTSLFTAILTVAVTSAIGAAATFFLIRKLLLDQGINDWLACALAVFIGNLAVTVFFDGMEATLAIPLMLLTIVQAQRFIAKPVATTALVLGLLMSLTILSRLDAALWVSLLGLAALGTRPVRASLKPTVLLSVLAGLIPVGVYLILNHHYFDCWLPISGTAKQLKPTLAPSIRPLQSLVRREVIFPAVLSVIALGAIGTKWSTATVVERVVFVPTLLFPFVYYGTLCFKSDWPLWGWYSYPTIAQFAVASGMCLTRLLPAINRSKVISAVACIGCCLNFGHKRDWHQVPEISDASIDIARFSETHPGVYAMGDRAGSVGYLLKSPLVQLEGLVMDKPFLENIKQQRPLKTVLQQYGVRYYITTIRGDYTGVVNAREPAQAGPQSPRMTSVFTEKPVALFHHGLATTVIFDLGSSSLTGRSAVR